MALGLTKEVVSISLTPAAIMDSMICSFCGVGTKSGQDWKPSRGATSRIFILLFINTLPHTPCGEGVMAIVYFAPTVLVGA
jgi:hypothetical protein